jgi:outer membrane protein assembly factor BamB
MPRFTTMPSPSCRQGFTAAGALCLLSVAGASLPAADWPEWGGRNQRNMVSDEKDVPDHFDPGKKKEGSEEIDLATTKNVKWVVKLGSQTYGGVVIGGGKLLIGTNNESPRDPKYQGDRGILMCFDEKTGKYLWQLSVPKHESGKVNDWEYLGITSTPFIEGDRAYLVTNRCEVLCLNMNGMANGNQGPFKEEAQYFAGPGKPPIEPGPTDADIIWRYDMMDELGVFPHNASNCSVLISGDLLYTCTSNGMDWTHINIPSPNSPGLIALDKNDGKLRGEENAKISQRVFHGQWCSPSLASVNGREELLFGGGDGFCYAFDPKPVQEGDTAYLKKIWWFDANPEEFKTKNGKKRKYPDPEGYSEIIATPVLYNNRVYVATGQDPEHGEGVGLLHCIDATKTGDITKGGAIWTYDKIHRSISTVAIHNGLLFVGDFSGFVHCLDAETGKVYWVHDAQSHIWGSPLIADGKVYIGDESGNLTILAEAKEKKVINTINMGAPVLSTPVFCNGVLYIASQTHLYAVQNGAGK